MEEGASDVSLKIQYINKRLVQYSIACTHQVTSCTEPAGQTVPAVGEVILGFQISAEAAYALVQTARTVANKVAVRTMVSKLLRLGDAQENCEN